MNQAEVRRFAERYFAAFSSHVLESHPAYFTVKLPEEVDKDIGNRPFYWTWIEKMNIPPQPLVITFTFDPEQKPEGLRSEYLHFGSGRLQQIFQSTRRHGRFVCLYEQMEEPSQRRGAKRRSTVPLTPWLNLNLKISFICDKKRDVLLYLGINLYHPQVVHDFYLFARSLRLGPSIPDYAYTLERRLGIEKASELAEREVSKIIAQQDDGWAEEARTRLAEEIEILTSYYDRIADQTAGGEPDNSCDPKPTLESETAASRTAEKDVLLTIDEHTARGGRILDFLRVHTIPETPREEIDQSSWKQSTPAEEKERRIAELKWQYEPRIEISLINGGLFYLYTQPASAGSHTDGRNM
ncbi:MAG: hypothetical protein H0Z34_05525 [Brevibacillus sp.]|nr:hypothetical protein [Brevibacillus sp.]